MPVTGERDFSVAGHDLLVEIERRHELAEHCGLVDRLQAAAAGRDEGAFRDQIEHVAGAAGRAIAVLLVERLGVAIAEPTPKYIFRRRSSLVFPRPGCGTAFPPGFRRCFDLGMVIPLRGADQMAGTILPLPFMSNLACCEVSGTGKPRARSWRPRDARDVASLSAAAVQALW